ncbi:hypothetical protein pipiens_003647 [Culex pipiens pipiens]|uniref:Uncharacterized protein n=1 Tax=Culex pipiens pipiens TaxID=38569 RepID=A0ABD1CUK6_CULPP
MVVRMVHFRRSGIRTIRNVISRSPSKTLRDLKHLRIIPKVDICNLFGYVINSCSWDWFSVKFLLHQLFKASAKVHCGGSEWAKM